MTMHTEGPWSVAETRHNYDTVIRGPKGEPIALAVIAGYTKQEGAANTALLAAAPEMLLALQTIARKTWHRGTAMLHEEDMILVTQAIARATGEQP